MPMYFNPFPSFLSIILLSFPSWIVQFLFPSLSFSFISSPYFFFCFCLCLSLHWFLPLSHSFFTPLLLYIISSWLPQSALYNLTHHFRLFPIILAVTPRITTNTLAVSQRQTSSNDASACPTMLFPAVRTVGTPVPSLSHLLGSSHAEPAQFQAHICFTRTMSEYQRHAMWKQILSCQALNK